jgi:hypothetical protein
VKRAAALLCAALLCAPVFAQQVYRCGADGREYSQTPCAQASTMDVSDTRTAAQREQAQANAARDMKLASQLEQERRAREASAQGQKAAGFHPAPSASQPAKGAKDTTKGKKKKKPKAPSERTRV